MAASPSRPVLPTDRKPGGSSCLSPATRRRPASVTATDGKPPAPPYRGPGDQTPPCPRGARTAGLASPSVVDRTVRSVITDGARNDRPAWPGPPRPYKSKHAAPRSKSLAKAASLTRGEAKGHQPGEGRRTPRSCTADAARKREDGQPRQRSSPRSSAPSGAGLSRGAPQGALRGEARATNGDRGFRAPPNGRKGCELRLPSAGESATERSTLWRSGVLRKDLHEERPEGRRFVNRPYGEGFPESGVRGCRFRGGGRVVVCRRCRCRRGCRP